jgi:thioredoxin 1
MKNSNKIIISLILIVTLAACGENQNKKQESQSNANKELNAAGSNVKITFIELGSVTCIPCKQMQPVMKSIEEKFGGSVKVVFHDVWKDKAAQKKYNIELIPTQVFLDENGNEFFRHQGFFAENEIVKLFESRGVKPINN